MPKNVGELGKLIVAKGFEKLPKIQKIAQSGHTGFDAFFIIKICTSEYFTLIIIQKQMIGAHSGFELRTARWSAKIVPEYYIPLTFTQCYLYKSENTQHRGMYH